MLQPLSVYQERTKPRSVLHPWECFLHAEFWLTKCIGICLLETHPRGRRPSKNCYFAKGSASPCFSIPLTLSLCLGCFSLGRFSSMVRKRHLRLRGLLYLCNFSNFHLFLGLWTWNSDKSFPVCQVSLVCTVWYLVHLMVLRAWPTLYACAL